MATSSIGQKNAEELKLEKIEQENNIARSENVQLKKSRDSLLEKSRRYILLKQAIEDINKDMGLDYAANSLTSVAFSLISNNQGITKLYLINPSTQKLELFKTKKEDKKVIIKEKEGDCFDYWVLRHLSPLLIEDIGKDFRFDLSNISSQLASSRNIASLVSAPLVTEQRFLGIIRIDSQVKNFFSQEDLRLLVTISDFGAVALENADLFKKTQDLAIHDGLTGVYTKGYFVERLNEECKRSFRQQIKFSLLMLDVDLFKNYNDQFGHTAGDIVLKTITKTIYDFLNEFNPVIGRFGGEEFCVIIPKIEKERSFVIAQGLRSAIENTKINLRRCDTNVTVSIGVASFAQDAEAAQELILKADRAMYKAKQEGRNRVENA